jgi:hypothetical protein
MKAGSIMAKLNLQFHATQQEIIELIKKSLNMFSLYMISIHLFPTFQQELISVNEFEDKLSMIKECEMIFLRTSKPGELQEDYMKFLDDNKNSLVFSIGEQNDKILKESSIGTIAEDVESLKVWKKIINEFKKNMLKGAWVVDLQNGSKEFYKNYFYTQLAKKEFENGVEILPIAGWNKYVLSQEFKDK